MKILVLIGLLCIAGALFGGLFSLLKTTSSGSRRRTVQSLTARISLSLGLFCLLIVGALCGWWQPHQL